MSNKDTKREMSSLRWNIAINPDKALRPTAMKRSGSDDLYRLRTHRKRTLAGECYSERFIRYGHWFVWLFHIQVQTVDRMIKQAGGTT